MATKRAIYYPMKKPISTKSDTLATQRVATPCESCHKVAESTSEEANVRFVIDFGCMAIGLIFKVNTFPWFPIGKAPVR
jgi:hypothetical protein